MSAQLSAWLLTSLAKDESALSALPDCLRILTLERLVLCAERETAEHVLHRWCLRVSALIASPRDSLSRSIGFDLATETSRQSETLFLTHAKPWTNAALAALNYLGGPAKSHIAALTFASFALANAARLPEFSREVFKPDVLKQLAADLCSLARHADVALDTRRQALDLLSLLLELYAITWRPSVQPGTGAKAGQGPYIQDTCIHLLCVEPTAGALRPAASRLFAHLWLVAGKKDGSERYQQTLEALCGSCHATVLSMSRSFEQDRTDPYPAPLQLPDVPSRVASPFENVASELHRLETLIHMACAMLSDATERSVAVPVGALMHVIEHGFALTVKGKTREVADPLLRLAEVTALPSLHLAMCRLLAQMSVVLGSHLSAHTTRLLALVSHLVDSYASAAPARSALLSAMSVLLQHAYMDPRAAPHFCKLFRCLLSDIAALTVTRDVDRAKPAINGTDSKRKAKRARFEVDQTFALRPPVSEAEMAIADQALASVERLLQSPASAFCHGDDLNGCLRMLLGIAVHPAFCASSSPAMLTAADSIEYIMSKRPLFRASVLRALLAGLEIASQDAAGLLERALPVLSRSSASGDSDVRELAARGLEMADKMLHPRVPPMMPSEKWHHVSQVAIGGPVGPPDTRAPATTTGDSPSPEPVERPPLEVPRPDHSSAPPPPVSPPPRAFPTPRSPEAQTIPPVKPLFAVPASDLRVDHTAVVGGTSAAAVAAAATESPVRIDTEDSTGVAAETALDEWPQMTADSDDDEPFPTLDPRSSSEEALERDEGP